MVARWNMNCKFPENLFGWIFEMFEGILEFKFSFWSSPKVIVFVQEAFDWDLEYFWEVDLNFGRYFGKRREIGKREGLQERFWTSKFEIGIKELRERIGLEFLKG